MALAGPGYLGDFVAGVTFDFKFSITIADVPTTLGGAPVVKVYKDNDTTTEVTTGLTLTADFDGVVGLNNVHVVTTDAFYATAHEYTIVITTGATGAVSAVGLCPAS